MNKELLSEIALYTGLIKLPNGIVIDPETLRADILLFNNSDKPFQWSKSLDTLDTYIRDFYAMNYHRFLIKKDTYGDMYNSDQITPPLLQVDHMDLKNSPDFVMLYGVKIEKDSCSICIEYDDNRLKNKHKIIKLNTNKFILFPSNLVYYINNASSETNYILTTTYELK